MEPVIFATTSVFFSAYSASDFFGKWIFIGLFALSIVTWLILIRKVSLYRSVRKEALQFQEVLTKNQNSILSIPIDEICQGAKERIRPFYDIYCSFREKTVDILDKNYFFHQERSEEKKSVFLSAADLGLIEARLGMVITQGGKGLEKNLFILATIISLAPFLGILGTVWGILISLGELQQTGMAHANSVVLGGLSTALATTVLGLVIAIPALISYNYLKSVLKEFYTEMHDMSNMLLTTIEMQYRKVEVEP